MKSVINGEKYIDQERRKRLEPKKKDEVNFTAPKIDNICVGEGGREGEDKSS